MLFDCRRSIPICCSTAADRFRSVVRLPPIDSDLLFDCRRSIPICCSTAADRFRSVVRLPPIDSDLLFDCRRSIPINSVLDGIGPSQLVVRLTIFNYMQLYRRLSISSIRSGTVFNTRPYRSFPAPLLQLTSEFKLDPTNKKAPSQ